MGCSVGAGVYSLVGVGAQLAGPSISLSFFISGVACVFTSLTYSEFAARVPVMESELMGVMYRERETEGCVYVVYTYA